MRLVIINCEPTDLNSLADLVQDGEIGATLGDAVGVTREWDAGDRTRNRADE